MGIQRTCGLSKLKPCPFCGGKAHHSYDGEWRYVRCTACGSIGKSFSVIIEQKGNNLEVLELAGKAWNLRVKTK